MLSNITSCAVIGVDGWIVGVEVDIARGLPVFSTVGLPDVTVKESKDRVKSAITNCGYKFPAKRITVNLAPADIRKEGAGFDLPIAIGILEATEAFTRKVTGEYCVIGELSLDGSIRKVKGILSIITAAKEQGCKGILIPSENLNEARLLIDDIEIIPVKRLQEAVEFFAGESWIHPGDLFPDSSILENADEPKFDFSEIKGQQHAKRGLEIAAAGGHNVLLVGPPGAGKTMLARHFPSILPKMNRNELLETTKIHSVSSKVANASKYFSNRPFRSPHHTISDAGLIGGGNIPQPGEVSLAHNGVLFLDELPEFKKSVLEVLRQPIEDGEVTIARANMTLTFPARFTLIAAMNPCPCGFLGDSRNSCNCSENDIRRYTSKISGPLMDRIDMQIETPALDYKDMSDIGSGETSRSIKHRVDNARVVQQKRFSMEEHINCNSQMGSKEVEKYCKIDQKSSEILEKSAQKLGLSARAYFRTLKTSRTIADLDDSGTIGMSHVAEAIQLCRVVD